MSEVQKTVNVTEAIQARINVLTHQKTQYENDLAALKNTRVAIEKSADSGNGMGCGWLIGICFVLVAFVAAPLLGILVGVIIMVAFIASKNRIDAAQKEKEKLLILQRNESDKQIGEVHKLLSETTNKLQEAERQKLEILLSYEREILAAQNDEIVSATESIDTKECPECAETIKLRAKVCRYCGYKFETI